MLGVLYQGKGSYGQCENSHKDEGGIRGKSPSSRDAKEEIETTE